MTAARQQMITLEAIEAMLLRRLDTLARELAPAGARHGAEWVALNPCRADAKPGSFSINLATGKWADFAAGDASSRAFPCLSLIAYLATRGRWRSEGEAAPGCIRYARDWLGLTDRHVTGPERSKLNEEAERGARIRAAEVARAGEAKRKRAQATWLNGAALAAGDPAWTYLRGRGIDLAALADGAPGSLHYAPNCRHYADGGSYTEHPALLAAMHLEGAPDGFAAVHRTYLRLLPDGSVGKAFGRDSKKILGAKSGATIRLTRGPSGKPLARAPAGEWIALAEGVENGLSAALATRAQDLAQLNGLPGLRVLAAGTLENIGKAVLPPQIGGIYVIADNDRPGSAAEDALEAACNQIADRGMALKVVRAPKGFKDFNDALCGKRMEDA